MSSLTRPSAVRRLATALMTAMVVVLGALTCTSVATAQAPNVAIAPGPSQGYWVAAADGGVFSFGDAAFHGSMGGKPLSKPVVAIAATPDARGYLLAAADGGVFAFGNAPFYGSMGGKPLNAPIVGVASAPAGNGYWLVAADGGVFAFGSAGFHGSMGGKPLSAPVVGMAAAPDGKGYWLVAANLARMLAAAKAAGRSLCGSGYRDSKRPIELRIKNCGGRANIYKRGVKCRPPTAIPGTSMHEKGARHRRSVSLMRRR